MGIYDMYQGYIDPNQQKLALAQALFAAAAGMSGPQARGQSTIGNITQGLAQGTGMYQQAMNNALQQSFATRRLKEMQEEDEFQKRIKTGLETPINETRTVTEARPPEDMPQYDPGTLTPDMYQQSVTKNMSRMPGPGDYMDIYSKAAMESGRPDRVKEAIALQTSQEDRSYNRGVQFFNAVKQYVKDPNKQAELVNNSPYAKTLGFSVTPDDMGQGLISLTLDDGTTVRVEPDKALNYLRLKEDSAARREIQQEITRQRGESMDLRRDQMETNKALRERVPAGQLQELSELKTTYDRLGDVAAKAEKLKDKFGPVEGRWNQLKVKFAKDGQTQGIINELNSMITIAYGLSGKQISYKEMELLKEAMLPRLEQPYENFQATLKFAQGWLANTHDNKLSYLEDGGYKPNIKHLSNQGGAQKTSPPPGYNRKFYSPSTGKTKYIYPDGREVIQ